MHNKLGEMLSTSMLAKLILVLVSGLILLTIISLIASDETSTESLIQTCRASVEAREFAAKHTADLLRASVPMLCKSMEIEIPEDPYFELATTNYSRAVMMNIADRAMDCWYMFGQGVFHKDVFGTTFFTKNKCFSCFVFTLKDDRRFDSEEINVSEFYNFLFSEPYKPVPRNVPFCLHDDEEQINCVPRGASECERKGGFCFEKDEEIGLYYNYEGWSCDSRKKSCHVYPNMVESYIEHMLSKSPGLVTLGSDLIKIDENELGLDQGDDIEIPISEPVFEIGELYSISFISETKDWGWAFVHSYGISSGIYAAVVSGITALLSNPVILIPVLFIADPDLEQIYEDVVNLLTGDEPTIFISTLKEIDKECKVVKDFNQ